MRKTYQVANQNRSYLYVDNHEYESKILKALEAQLNDNEKRLIGVDLETTPLYNYKEHSLGGLNPHISSIATVQVSPIDGDTDVIFHVHKYGFSTPLKAFLQSVTPIAHNSIFEYQHLKHVGVVYDDIHDSMLLFRLLIQAKRANFKSFKADLANLYSYCFKDTLAKDMQKSNWGADVLTDEQLEYAVRDAYVTNRCFFHLLSEAKQFYPEILTFYKLNRLALPGIGDMVYHGVKIDRELHSKMIKGWTKEADEAELELSKILPKEVNTKSPKQLGEWLESELSKTEDGKEALDEWPLSEKTGLLKCDADTLTDHAYLPVVAPLIKFKKLQKLLSTYGENINNFIIPISGRAHPQYTQCFTGSGRLSSHSFNIQNGPRGDYRAIFTCDKDNVLIGADYGSIEVRVYAHHSEDPTMLEAFDRGLDMYSIVAALITGKKLAEIDKKSEERQKAKAILLGRLFLLGAKTLVGYADKTYNVQLSLEEAKDIIDLIDNTFVVGHAWQMRRVEETKKSLRVVSKMGKVRVLFEDDYYNKSVNHAIQSDACAIMLIAITKVRLAFKENYIKGFLYCTVHDELLVEVAKTQEKEATEILTRCMQEAMLEVFPTATLTKLVEAKSGNTWLETK